MKKEEIIFLNNVRVKTIKMINEKGTHIESNIVKLGDRELADNKNLKIEIPEYWQEFIEQVIKQFKREKRRTVLTWKLWKEYLNEKLGH